MIVLDTHAWLFWRGDPTRLGPAALVAIESADQVGVSAISAWEVSTLARRGRIGLDSDPARWVRRALVGARTVELPVTARRRGRRGIARNGFPGDPADRIIYATAVTASASLVARDRAIAGYDPRRTVW